MKKLLIIFASIMMIGAMTTSCKKDDASDEIAVSDNQFEEMLIGSWGSWCIFYADHTFTMPNVGTGKWSLNGTVLTLKYDKEQTSGWYTIYYITSISTSRIRMAGWDNAVKKG